MAIPEVRPVDGRRLRSAFVDLPYRLYQSDPYWIAPLRADTKKALNPSKSAFYEHGVLQAFVALDADGEVVGRIAAIENGMHLRTHDDGAGFFGFFESVDDQDVANALFDAAARWIADRGLRTMRGPVNPSLNDTAGLLIAGFETRPFVLMTHNPPYYARLLETAGFERAMTLWAYYVHRAYAKAERLKRGVALVRRRYPGLVVRNMRMDRFHEEAQLIREIYNEAWSNNWGFVPMTEREFDQLASDLKQVIDERMAFFLELDGEPVAFAVSLPNINLALRPVRNGRLFPTGIFQLLARMKFGAVHEIRMPIMGVRKAYHGRGFDALLVLETVEKLPPLGYTACEMSWVLDTNMPLRNALDSLGAVAYKEYALFERPVG